MTASSDFPTFRQVALDTEDARGLAEFYRQLLGLRYDDGDELPTDGSPDTLGADWLTLLGPDGKRLLAFQQVPSLPPATWPEGPRPQQLHLDFAVGDVEALGVHRDRALELGATLLRDESAHPEQPLYVFADPSGHPFCLFVATENP